MKVNYSGYVLDEFGQPLIGANVISLTGTTRGTITDMNGFFSMREEEGERFKISYVGFKPMSFMVTGNTFSTPTYKLVEDVTQLDEVILTPRNPKTPPLTTSVNHQEPQLSAWDKFKDNPMAMGGLLLAGFFIGGLILSKVAQASDKVENKRLAAAK